MITYLDLKGDEEIQSLIDTSEEELGALGYTEHSNRHLTIVANLTGKILKEIGQDNHTVELGKIAGYLHDIGNAVNRYQHAQSGAILAYDLLVSRGLSYSDASSIMLAIGNHDESNGMPVSIITACLILADKSDVHHTRVRKVKIKQSFEHEDDIHDRVNFASKNTILQVDNSDKTITLKIEIDTAICTVMDYFEIYFTRMSFCKKAANYLGYRFGLEINNSKLL